MNKILLIILILPFLTYCQSTKNISELKRTTEQNENSIIGSWKFQKLIDRTGIEISEVPFELNDTIKGIEIIARPSIRINENGTYELFDCPNPDSCDKGTWKYNKKDNAIILTFDKPVYNVPIDKLAPVLLEKLKENGTLIEFTEDVWNISLLTENEMRVFEYLSGNEIKPNYNLRILRRK